MSALAAGVAGCKSNPAAAPIITNNAAADANGPDPAAANMASYASAQPTRVMGQSQSYTPQQQGESYPAGQQAPAPIVQGYNNNAANNEAYSSAQTYSGQTYSAQPGYDQGYADGEVAEAATAPPPLPVYDQPPAPDPNDLWTPGYWNYASTGYYWVPGAWVAAPYYGALWTPPYWGWYGNRYRFHHGFWGPHIGYYGGINYGFGYIGTGYYGGYWRGHDFFYNRAVNNVNITNVRNVYNRTVVVNNVTYEQRPAIRTSYNGGPGGINVQPRPFEIAAEHERHEGPLPSQVALRQAAMTNHGNFFAANGGRPAQAAFVHPPNALAPLPANNPGQAFNRAGAPGGEPFNRGNAPGAQPGSRPVAPAQPFNRPAEPGFANRENHGLGTRPVPANEAGHNATPGFVPGRNRSVPSTGHPGFHQPGEPAVRPGAVNPPAANQGFHRPAVNQSTPEVQLPGNQSRANPGSQHQAPAANQDFHRPGVSQSTPEVQLPGNQPRANPGFQHQAPAANQDFHRPTPAANPGFNRPAPEANSGFNRAAPQGSGSFNRPQPSAPHVETPRPAPAPHVETPQAAPAPHIEAPRPAPAPHVEAPHPGPAPGGGGGHPH